MNRRTIVALLVLLFFAPSFIQAHFIWVDVPSEPTGDSQARVYFGELPEPGESHLIGKIAHAKAWVRDLQGHSSELELNKSGNEKLPALVAAVAKPKEVCVDATCDYGVYQAGPKAALIQYYAKHLPADWINKDQKLVRSEKLRLDIIPKYSNSQLAVQVLYDGQPDPASEVIVVDPKAKQHTLKTDEVGLATLASAMPGHYAIRAGHIEADRSGARDGKSYAQTWHYVTLTLDLPPSQTTSVEISAVDALARARAGRAIWSEFPGFTADVKVSGDNQSVVGKATIDADGVVSLELTDSPLRKWADEQLSSLVQHRMPDGEVNESTITYVEEAVAHPLGRKIDLGDPALESRYRIKDDVILEVNRKMGKTRFVISVLEIVRNAENKYLPRAFTMNFFDVSSGKLKSGVTYWNDWQRVGSFDLPKTILEVNAHDGSAETKQIVFTNCQLLKKK